MTALVERTQSRSQSRFRSDGGFTLIEILVVLAIVSILITVTTPSMRAFTEGRRLRTAGDALKSLCLFARDIASTDGDDYIVVLDFENQRYWLAMATSLDYPDLTQSVGVGAYGPESETAEQASGASAAGSTTAAATESGETVLNPRVAGILGQARSFGQGIALAQLDVDRDGSVNSISSSSDYVQFYANGTAEPASIFLMNTTGDAVVVDVPMSAAQTRSRVLTDEELAATGIEQAASQ